MTASGASSTPLPKTTAVAVVWGGIGDIFLASGGLEAFRVSVALSHQPVLVCEKRSAGASPFLASDWQLETLTPVARHPVLQRLSLFFKAWQTLSRLNPEIVVTNGTHPLLPVLLWLSGAKQRIGYQTLKGSWVQRLAQRLCLTQRIPLNTQRYAGHMYATVYAPGMPHASLPSLELLRHQDACTRMMSWLERQTLRKQGYVLVHPGCSTLSKQKGIDKEWASADWVQWLQHYTDSSLPYPVVLVGGPDDTSIIQTLQEAPELQQAWQRGRLIQGYGVTRSLQDLGVLIEYAKVFVCIDSSPLQLGIASSTPVVTLFGPTDPFKIIPPAVLEAGKVQVVTVDTPLACQPCLWDKRTTCCDTPVCLSIAPEKVQQAVENLCQCY
ncbi:MAG: glycosyltransferase family 9 protein [Vampirovibrionales bacterium]